jgi:hypothetical protein
MEVILVPESGIGRPYSRHLASLTLSLTICTVGLVIINCKQFLRTYYMQITSVGFVPALNFHSISLSYIL